MLSKLLSPEKMPKVWPETLDSRAEPVLFAGFGNASEAVFKFRLALALGFAGSFPSLMAG